MNPQDATSMLRQAAHTQTLKESLEQTRQEYEQFAGRIAHDLHAVLRNIDGFAAALDDQCGPQLEGRGRHFLQRIRANAARGGGLIEALQAYDRLASSPMVACPVDSRRLVERAWQRIQEAQSHAGQPDPVAAIADWRVEGSFPPVLGDAPILEQAVLALLSNALRFRRDGVVPAITVTGTARDGMLELQVADNGIGLDPTDIHRLFQPFERLRDDEPGAEAGAGMGLACVRRIAERHGGSAIADARPGEGAVFTLVLPLARTEAMPAAPDDPAGPAGSALRILLIDDDPLVLSSVQAMLERMGHRVTSASGGIRGLLSFEHGLRGLAFDLVITDWGMPHVGGGRVVQAVKRISPATPVVVLTGRPPVGEEAADLALVDLVLNKPLRLGQLRAALEAVRPGPAA